MKCVILCGGRGIIDPETRQRIPKALMQVGGRPLIWHIMKTFAAAGHTDFILALGEGGDAIRRSFLNNHIESRDIELVGGSSDIRYLTPADEESWTIKCVDTGQNAQTGSRIARCRRYLESEQFFVTYSDCLCNVDLGALCMAHQKNGNVITVTGVQPPSRFGTFIVSEESVTGYSLEAKLTGIGGYLNGGYMVTDERVFDYLQVFSECNLERDVLPAMLADQAIGLFPHDGYWQAVDTERELELVTRLHLENQRPWLSLRSGPH